jgi:hypothetical protein
MMSTTTWQKVSTGILIVAGALVLFGYGCNVFVKYKVKEVANTCPVRINDTLTLDNVVYDGFFHATYTYHSENILSSAVGSVFLNNPTAIKAMQEELCKNNRLINEYALDVTEVYKDRTTGETFVKYSVTSEECDDMI